MSNIVPFPGQEDKDTAALNFFHKVLPEAGLYYVFVKKGKQKKNLPCESLEALWDTVKEYDLNGWDTYFALARFSDNSGRTQANAAQLSSLWLDIDVGTAGHRAPGYEYERAAYDAIKAFCQKVDLPHPIIIRSGGGLHCYLPFKEAISREKWQGYANGLKAACFEHGLKAGSECTADAARVLRPPFTLNRKIPGVTRETGIVDATEKQGPFEWASVVHLLGYSSKRTNLVRLSLPPRPAYLGEYQDDQVRFAVGPATQVEFDRIRDACGQLRRDWSNLSEPTWHRLSGLMPFIIDGVRYWHKLSIQDPRYSREQSQNYYDRASKLTGPPPCQGFFELDEESAAICRACDRFGVVKNPFQELENENVSEAMGETRETNENLGKTATSKTPFDIWETTEKGAIKPLSFKNTCIAIGRLGIECRYDTFHNKKLVNGIPNLGPFLDDEASRKARILIINAYRFEPGKPNVGEALESICEANAFDPVADYLNGLRWDGYPRLDEWVVAYLGSWSTPLNRCFGRKTLIAACRRVFEPGCKFDHLLVLEGVQGAGKSSAWRILAGDENFSDATIRWDDPRRQQEVAAGVWIHEIAELAGLRRADVEAIKAFLSRQDDKARPAYGRFERSQPRQCLFVGTTNGGPSDGYLSDYTGARRFWPLPVGRIDLEALKRDRDQLWAEAVHYCKEGEDLLLPEELWPDATLQQKARSVDEPWMDKLIDVRGEIGSDGKERIHSIVLLQRELGLTIDRVGVREGMRLRRSMLELGWSGPVNMWVEGKQGKGYERKPQKL